MYSPSFTLVFNYVWNGIPAWYKCLEKMRCKFRFAFYSRFLFILIKVTYYIRFTLFFLLLYFSICKLCNIKVSALPLSLYRFLDENACTCTPCNVCVYTTAHPQLHAWWSRMLKKRSTFMQFFLVRNIYFYFFNERCWPTTTSKVQNKGHVSWTWSTWPY